MGRQVFGLKRTSPVDHKIRDEVYLSIPCDFSVHSPAKILFTFAANDLLMQ